jgi:hypothetical protein
MAGPLGIIAPSTDPNWAYDTPGWTNQGNTGDVEGSQLAGASFAGNAFLGEPEALSGYIARSIDPSVLSTVASNFLVMGTSSTTAYFAAVDVIAPAKTSAVVIYAKSVSSSTSANVGLYNSAGVQLTTAAPALTTSVAAVKTSWSAAQILAPGTYYVGVTTSAAVGVDLCGTSLTVEQALLPEATTFAAGVLNFRFFNVGSLTANSLPSPISGTISAGTYGFFVGLG